MKFYTPESDQKGKWLTDEKTGMPNVLIIGDSISVGYTLRVADKLQKEANVFRPIQPGGYAPINCGDTRLGLKEINNWLGDRKWKVIHFNWGLHDLCYRHPDSPLYGNRDKVKGEISVPLNEYGENLTKLLHILKATGASLIWASTTEVPEGEGGRFVGDEIKYNAVSSEIMENFSVHTNDLYALMMNFKGKYFSGPADVHYTAEGYDVIAEQIASEIRKFL